VLCSQSPQHPCPSTLTTAPPASKTRMLVQSVSEDDLSSSKSSASKPPRFRTPHDRRNTLRPRRLHRLCPEPQPISVSAPPCISREFSHHPSSPIIFKLDAAHASSNLPVPSLHTAPPAAKSHSIPRGSSRLRSMNSIRSAPARPFRLHPVIISAGALPIEGVSLSVVLRA
jgi:hypothetical protein